MSLKLNIGAGDTTIKGYTPVDRKFGSEAYPLDYPDDSAEEIRASHILEHFGWGEIDDVLKDWVRVLKPGGEIYIAVPDFPKAVKMGEEKTDPLWHLYITGGQTDENDYHKTLWTDAFLRERMEAAGLANIDYWTSENTDAASLKVSLNMKGTKPGNGVAAPEPSAPTKAKIRCVYSMPRLGFTDNFFCAGRVFPSRGIEIHRHVGVYFGQCMERVMMECLEDGMDYICTSDYDTVFDGEIFDELVRLMDTHPEADAIAPIQMKREEDVPFIWRTDRDGVPLENYTLQGELTQIEHAHFGLTLFRASSLRDLPHPWFWDQPNEQGEWGEGRMDADIWFWEKFKAYHKKLFVANHVSIGHLQLVASWPKAIEIDGRLTLGVHHQHANDFAAKGVPKEEIWQ